MTSRPIPPPTLRDVLRDPSRWGRPNDGRKALSPAHASRRRFLRGAAGTAFALPLLTSLAPKRARGQEGPTFPKRLIILNHPNGVVPEAWFPTPGANDYEFDLATCHQPLAPFKDHLVITRGIDMPSVAGGPGEPHQSGMGGVLTGWPLLEPSAATGSFVGGDGSLAGWGSSISVDQRVAQEIGGGTKLASLQLGVRCTTAEVRSRISYLGPAWPLPPINDPRATFDALFADFDTEEGALARLHAKRRSVLDTVLEQFDHVVPRLSSIDRARLEGHQTMVRELEQRLSGGVAASADCKAPPQPGQIDWDHEMNMPLVTSMQIEMIALALACDLTRVVTLQFSNAQNHIRMPWVDKAPDDPVLFDPALGDGHSLSHAGPSAADHRQEIILRDTWYAEQVAYLLAQLRNVDEGEGTMLDNTLVLWTNELSVGNTHSHVNMPFVLAGKAGGAIETGRYLQYESASHNELLLSILHAFGVYEESFGDPAFCPGPLAGLVAT